MFQEILYSLKFSHLEAGTGVTTRIVPDILFLLFLLGLLFSKSVNLLLGHIIHTPLCPNKCERWLCPRRFHATSGVTPESINSEMCILVDSGEPELCVYD